MATIRPGIELDEEPPSQTASDSNTILTSHIGDLAPSVAPTTSQIFTYPLEGGSSSCSYQNLSAFRDLNKLHNGRHSVVWSGVCQSSGKTVVIKGYNRESLKPRQLDNVRREISLLGFFRTMRCKGVVGLLDVFEDKAMICLVFEACMGGDLYAHLMRNRGTLHEEFVVTKVVFPLLSVLQHLHSLQIVHRDIKPENIFLTENGDIALGDFGLAGHKFQDRMTERVGTLDYMAPEVLSIHAHDDQFAPTNDSSLRSPIGVQAYDEKIDVWAAGVLVYELLVGRPPFEVDDPQETARLVMTEQASNYPVHISQYARDFVAQALTKCSEARPSAEQLLQHAWLRHYFGGKVPDTLGTDGGGATAGLLKSWLVASRADLSNSRSTGALDGLMLSREIGVQSSGYIRKSVPGSSEGGSTAISPRALDASTQQVQAIMQQEGIVSFESGDGEASILDRDTEQAVNRLAASQYPSRDSSTGSMDQSVHADRVYARNDSGASGSSGISIASFASLQHMPGNTSITELGEQNDLGLVQRSASICPANISRMPGSYPSSGGQLKPAWQSSTPIAGSRKPGKSRFAG